MKLFRNIQKLGVQRVTLVEGITKYFIMLGKISIFKAGDFAKATSQ